MLDLLVIGGTGSLGREVVRLALKRREGVGKGSGRSEPIPRFSRVRVLSRGDSEQATLFEQNARDPRLELVIGDITVPDSLPRHVGPVINCAALKSVWACEKYPAMGAAVNEIGAANVLRKYGAAAILVSTDKAVEPVSIYGAQKMVAERMFLNAGARVYRGVNFLGSSGSLLPLAEIQANVQGRLLLTDPDMRRYVMRTEDAAADLLTLAADFDLYKGGKVYLPSVYEAVQIADLLDEIAGRHCVPVEIIGRRPGEKLEEAMHWPEEKMGRDIQRAAV